jgi:hypothetical protein
MPFAARKSFPEASATDPAAEIMALWQPADGPGTGGVPRRGIAGQVYFFTRRQANPVKVEGSVRIYLFDNRGTAEDQSKPIHQFDYNAEVWNAHLQPSTLGAAYHVFIPYPRKDLNQATCSIRVRFIPKAGATLYSQMSSIELAGPPLKPEQTASRAGKPSPGKPTQASATAHKTAHNKAHTKRTISDARVVPAAATAEPDEDSQSAAAHPRREPTARTRSAVVHAVAAEEEGSSDDSPRPKVVEVLLPGAEVRSVPLERSGPLKLRPAE